MTDRPDKYSTPPSCTTAFNAVASDVAEVEVKFLVPELPEDPANPDESRIDKAAFPRAKSFFADLGWIKIQSENNPLLTRQLDTPDKALLKSGTTLRIRGNCPDGHLENMNNTDICVKLGKSQDESGAVRRGEYETPIKDFEHITIKPLLDKYPKQDHPELHAALDGIKAKDLREFFRIDCIRNRYVIEVPEAEHGLAGKRVAAELIMDDVAFVLDIPGLKRPLVYHQDLEIECEILRKPCSYDSSPEAKNYVSSPMTRAEADQAMSCIRAKIQEASGNILIPNTVSKAERGFTNLDEALEELKSIVEVNNALPRKSEVEPAFKVKDVANDSEASALHHLLARDFGPYIRTRPLPIARFGFAM